MNSCTGIVLIALMAHLIFFSNNALAYLGPGAGLGAMGSIIAIVVAILVIVMGVIIYPIRKYLSRKSKDE